MSTTAIVVISLVIIFIINKVHGLYKAHKHDKKYPPTKPKHPYKKWGDDDDWDGF